jgi:dihydrofolate reductase
MKISIIVAVSTNEVIGKDNKLIWHLPDDMKFFKEKTMGHCIVSGRRNYESIPLKFRPLPGRTNIVLSRDKDYKAPGAIVTHEIGKALDIAKEKGETECFIIGGAKVFDQVMEMTDTLYYTRIFHDFEGDVFFKEPDPAKWKLVNRVPHPADERHTWPFEFCTYEKIKV